MKTIQKGNEVLRVSDEVANSKVGITWKYVSKSIWKQQVRDVERKQKAEQVKQPSEATSQTIAEKQLNRKKNNSKKV